MTRWKATPLSTDEAAGIIPTPAQLRHLQSIKEGSYAEHFSFRARSVVFPRLVAMGLVGGFLVNATLTPTGERVLAACAQRLKAGRPLKPTRAQLAYLRAIKAGRPSLERVDSLGARAARTRVYDVLIERGWIHGRFGDLRQLTTAGEAVLADADATISRIGRGSRK